MPRKLVFIESLDIFEYGHSLWTDDATPEEKEKRWQLLDELHALLENKDVGLSDKQKQCILWFLEGRTFTEMASMLGITYPGARGHYMRGVKKLRLYVDQHKQVTDGVIL